MADPYKTLGVSKSAGDSEIKSAYRKLAKKYHPDQNQGDPRAQEKFASVNTAYEILGDKDKRAKFDRGEIDADGRETGFGAGGPFGGNPFGGGGFARDGSRQAGGGRGGFSPEDILSEIFGGTGKRGSTFGDGSFGRDPFGGGGAGARTASSKGQDAEVTLNVDLEALGRDEKVRVSLPTGKTLSVNLPHGVVDGQTIRLKGQGYETAGPGPAGDAHITVKIKPHPLFERVGDNLRLDLPVTLDEAVLGAKITVPTLSGKVALGLPKGASSGQLLRIKERGIYAKNGKRGDILARVSIQLPKGPNPDLETIMQVWRDQRPYKVRGSEFD